jgi:hypothetical protein
MTRKAMFKVGDRVRLKDYPDQQHTCLRPEVARKYDHDPSPAWCLSGGGWDYEHNLELVAPPMAALQELTEGSLDRRNVLVAVLTERARQDKLFGEFGGLNEKTPFAQLSVLVEEVGELSKAINDGDLKHAHEELVQCAAVCIAMLEAAAATEPKGSL